MRHELTDHERIAIKLILPNKPIFRNRQWIQSIEH